MEKSLRSLAELKKSLDAVTVDVQRADGSIATINQEQARIRQNLAQLEKNSELYNRYIGKLAEQEDDLERLRKQLTELHDKEASKRDAVEEFVLNLNVE